VTDAADAAAPGGAHDALFDLAVARADSYLRRARRPASSDPADLRRALEAWALKTRFAARFDLDEIVRALAARPTASGVRWRGGRGGGWATDGDGTADSEHADAAGGDAE
jgi:hypothetical protein